MREYETFDLKAYTARVQSGPCFICDIVAGRDSTHHIVYVDEVAVAFLNKYPTLHGYTLVAPIEHREQVTGDFSLDEYLELQKRVYRVAEALRQELPTERVYILSLGSQQGNRHVHWHVAPLPPGIPYEEQQFAALMLEKRGYLKIPAAEMSELAKRLGGRMAAQAQEHG
jgi:diadenosine tetraphosphate (Ap4A) HIT family hydrolase